MVTTRTRMAIACVVLLQGLAGCTGSTEVPSAPSPPVASPAPPVAQPAGDSVLADATLSGMVYEVATDSSSRHVGIEGVSVYCEQCGESTHNFSYTDSKSEYVFPRGVWTEGRPAFPIPHPGRQRRLQDPAGLPKTDAAESLWPRLAGNGDSRRHAVRYPTR